jgi:hypothetical protein
VRKRKKGEYYVVVPIWLVIVVGGFLWVGVHPVVGVLGAIGTYLVSYMVSSAISKRAYGALDRAKEKKEAKRLENEKARQ